jgi:hypothetical protein
MLEENWKVFLTQWHNAHTYAACDPTDKLVYNQLAHERQYVASYYNVIKTSFNIGDITTNTLQEMDEYAHEESLLFILSSLDTLLSNTPLSTT